MIKTKEKSSIKSYILPHYANDFKQQQLWDLYTIYSQEYSFHVKQQFNSFLNNNLNNTLHNTIGKKLAFSHLGSTKHHITQLSSGFLQANLAQVSSTLNNYLANIKNKFTTIINNSTIKDADLLHQIRSINSQHKWLWKNKEIYYYPELMPIMDDFGNTILVHNKYKLPFPVSKKAKNLAHKVFKNIIANHHHGSKNFNKARVRFPNLSHPKLVLDSRLFEYQESDNSTLFHSWLHISTLTKKQRISIPLRTYDFFNGIKNDNPTFNGLIGGTVEILFKTYPYKKINKNIILPRNSKRKANYKESKINREIQFFLNRKSPVVVHNKILLDQKEKTVAIDLGMVTLIATSEGELLGNRWLDQLSIYDKKITQLAAERQKLGLKTRSQRYDNLITRVRGFIKTEINQI
jgi:hypothetical protein